MPTPAVIAALKARANSGLGDYGHLLREYMHSSRPDIPPDAVRALYRDQTQALGGTAPNPWLTSLMMMRQIHGDPNWTPGPQDEVYNALVSGLNPLMAGGKLQFPQDEARFAEADEWQRNLNEFRAAMGRLIPKEGSPGEGQPSSNPGAIGQVTGVSGPAIGLGLGTIGLAAPGIPGAVATTAGSLAAQGVPGLGIPGLSEDLSVTTESGPLAVDSHNMTSSIISAIASALQGITPTFSSHPTADVPDEDMSVSTSGPANAGWTDTAQLTSHPGDAAPGGAEPTAGPSSGSTPGGGPGGVGASGTSGPGGAPASGESGTGTGESMKRGGKVKGKGPKKITAHGGEYVINPRASEKFGTLLGAMNKAVPERDFKKTNETVDSLWTRARRMLEGENE